MKLPGRRARGRIKSSCIVTPATCSLAGGLRTAPRRRARAPPRRAREKRPPRRPRRPSARECSRAPRPAPAPPAGPRCSAHATHSSHFPRRVSVLPPAARCGAARRGAARQRTCSMLMQCLIHGGTTAERRVRGRGWGGDGEYGRATGKGNTGTNLSSARRRRGAGLDAEAGRVPRGRVGDARRATLDRREGRERWREVVGGVVVSVVESAGLLRRPQLQPRGRERKLPLRCEEAWHAAPRGGGSVGVFRRACDRGTGRGTPK
jgi:hypothetical protein